MKNIIELFFIVALLLLSCAFLLIGEMFLSIILISYTVIRSIVKFYELEGL